MKLKYVVGEDFGEDFTTYSWFKRCLANSFITVDYVSFKLVRSGDCNVSNI